MDLWPGRKKQQLYSRNARNHERVIVAGCDGFQDPDVPGNEISTVNLGAYVGASPAVLENKVYVGNFANQFQCIDLIKSKIDWQYANPDAHFPFYSSAVVTGKWIAVGGRDKLLHVLDPQSGKLLWKFANKARIDSSPVLSGNILLEQLAERFSSRAPGKRYGNSYRGRDCSPAIAVKSWC
jgi:outer membrane protein assembly factor BamB